MGDLHIPVARQARQQESIDVGGNDETFIQAHIHMLALSGGFGSLGCCQPADRAAHPRHPVADPASCLDWRIFQSSSFADAAGTGLKSEFSGRPVGFGTQPSVRRERNYHDIGALPQQLVQQALGQAVFNYDVGDFQQSGNGRVVCGSICVR